MANQAYIDRCGEQVFSPPFSAIMRDYFGLAVRADHEALNHNICKRYFNDPLGEPGRFMAFRYVIFVFNNVENACSLANEDAGLFSYQEAAIWMLIGDKKTARLRWFQPYIFVDDPVALVTGREIYGFPKTIGSFGIPGGPTPPDRLWVRTRLVKEKKTEGSDQLLIEARRRPQSAAHCRGCGENDFMARLLDVLRVSPEYFRKLGDVTEEMAENFYNDLIKMQLPLLFLREFRSAVNPLRAEGLVIQEAQSQIMDFYNAGIYEGSSYEVAINDAVSHPIRKDLGLDAGILGVDLAFYMSFSFKLGTCTRI